MHSVTQSELLVSLYCVSAANEHILTIKLHDTKAKSQFCTAGTGDVT